MVLILAASAACSSPASEAQRAEDVQPLADLPAPVVDVPVDAAADATPACPAEQASCGGTCRPACGFGAVRVEGDGCRCLDVSKPAPGLQPAVAERLGISVILPDGADAKSTAFRDFFWDRAKAIGLKVIRSDLRWDEIEPQPGVWKWEATDRVVQGHAKHGRRVVGMLAYGNPWASKDGKVKGDPYFPPDDPKDFAQFAGKVAQRYGQTVTDWEIWNEPNAGYRFWKGPKSPQGDPAAYAQLLHASAQAIHAVDPKARVAFGGVFYVPQVILGGEAFAQAAYATVPELAQSLDAFAYHPYALYPPKDPPEHQDPAPKAGPPLFAVDETARRLRQILPKKAGVSPPLWITELGWPVDESTIDLQDHARFLVRSWVLALAEDVQVLCWYTFMDQDPKADNVLWEKVFGLYSHDADVTDGTLPQPKPAAIAHEAMFQTLGPLGFSADERDKGTLRRLYAFASQDGQRVVHVAWDETVAADQTVAGYFHARPGRVYRLRSALLAPLPDDQWTPVAVDSEGRVPLQVGPTPLYVLETAPE